MTIFLKILLGFSQLDEFTQIFILLKTKIKPEEEKSLLRNQLILRIVSILFIIIEMVYTGVFMYWFYMEMYHPHEIFVSGK